MRKFKMKLWFFIILVFPTYSFSCDDSLSLREGFSLNLNYETKSSTITAINGSDYKAKNLLKCGRYAGNYLRIALGAESVGIFPNSSGYFYESNPNLGVYEIKNSIAPFQFENKETLLNDLLKKQKKLDSCIDIVISDEGNENLEILEGYGDCKATKTANNNEFVISSGKCAFKINEDSRFKLGVQESKNCLDKMFLKKEEFWPGDLSGNMKADVGALDQENKFKILKSAGSSLLNLRINPGMDIYKDLIAVGSSYQEASIWVLPDTQFKDIKIQKSEGETSVINFSLLIDNYTCENICKEGICTKPCNFLSPLAGEVIISEFNKNGGASEIGNSLVGEIIRPNWKGILNFRPIFSKNYDFKIGRKYKFDLHLTDPYLGYLNYKNQAKRTSSLNNGSLSLNNGMEIPSIGNFNTNSMFGDIDLRTSNVEFSIGGTYGGALSIGDRHLRFDNSLENLANFPQSYSLACNKNYSICKNPNSSNLGKLSVIFEVIGEKDGLYEIKVLELERNSKIIKGFKVEGSSFPKIISGNQEI